MLSGCSTWEWPACWEMWVDWPSPWSTSIILEVLHWHLQVLRGSRRARGMAVETASWSGRFGAWRFGSEDLEIHLCFMSGCISRSWEMELFPLTLHQGFEFGFRDYRWFGDEGLRSGKESGKKRSPKESLASLMWLLFQRRNRDF